VSFPGGAAVKMPYKGTTIRLGEMIDELIQNGSPEYSAATELGRALEEGAIILIFNDEPLSPDFIPGVAEYLQVAATRNAREIRLRFGWASDIIFHARALRAQFEGAFGLGAPTTEPLIPRQTAEQACEALILSLKEGPRLRKVEVHGRALAAIPDLKDKEFERAWRSTAGDWATGGRPPKTLN
jgi:hypothetical protein